MSYSLKGRNVLITGGSRGIGEATSERFAQEGSNIVINYVSNKERADALQARLSTEYPEIKVFAIQADVGNKADCEKLVQESLAALGGLDVIVSNAGWTQFAKNYSDLDELSEEAWDKCYAINCKAHLWLLKEAKPTFNSNPDGGTLIICASTAGLAPIGSSMAYGTSKAAALHLMRCLAASQGPKIRVNAVCPGLVLTEWGDKFSEELKEWKRQQSVLKRLAEASDIAEAFVSFAKNKAITGQKVVVDGGDVIYP